MRLRQRSIFIQVRGRIYSIKADAKTGVKEHLIIKLTKINGEQFVLNAELIRYIESRPDTYITLTSDDRLIVLESVDEVVRRSVDYSRSIRRIPGMGT